MDPLSEKEFKAIERTLELALEKKAALDKEYYKSSDPEQKFSLKAKVAELNEEIEALKSKLSQLGQGTSKPSAGNNGGSSSETSNIEALIRNGNEEILSRIETGNQGLHQRFDTLDTNIAALLQLSTEQKSEIAALYDKVDQGQVPDAQLENWTQEITDLLQANINQLPEKVVAAWKQVPLEAPESPGIKSKFKLVLPFVPGILSYETELDFNFKALAKRVWQDITPKKK